MTRKSKREIERALEELGCRSSSPRTDETLLEGDYSEEVRQLIYRVCRDLLRIVHQNPDTVVNQKGEEALKNYLGIVREEYALGDDQDDLVISGLTEISAKSNLRPLDNFTMAPVEIARPAPPTSESGEPLPELVERGDEEQAASLLVAQTYAMFAAVGCGDYKTANEYLPDSGSQREWMQ